MKVQKIIYWIATGLLSALMLYTAAMYFIKHEALVEVFARLGYPAYIIYPLAVAKILGIIAILTKKSKFLKELASPDFLRFSAGGFGAYQRRRRHSGFAGAGLFGASDRFVRAG